MTRFMKFLALAAVASIAAGAFAQKTPQLYARTKQMVPKFAYKISKIWKSADGKLHVEHGPAIPYAKSQVNPTRSTNTLFDMYEFDPAQVATSLTPIERVDYGTSCGLGGNRWYAGDAYVNGGSYKSMVMVPGTAGTTAQRCGVGWYDQIGVDFANMSLIIGTTENWDTTTPGGPFDGGANGRGDLDSWLISFGPDNNTGFYYTADLDTTDFGGAVSWGMPTDGTGGYYVVPGDFDEATNTYTIGASQCMMWGDKANNPSNFIDATQFDDDNAIDGVWDPANEYYDYTGWVTCPDPVGPMACFLGDAAQPVTLTPQSFNVGLGAVASGNLASLAADDANALKICKAFVPNFTSPRIRLDATYVSPYLTATSVQLDMKARMTTGGSFKIRGFLADTSGAGTFTYGATNQVIADTSIALTFATFSSGPKPATNHIDTDADATTDGTIVARTEIQQTGFSAVAVPCAEWEYMTVTVTP